MSLASPNKDHVIVLLLVSGERTMVEAHSLLGGYALHHPVIDGRQRPGCGWSVTHVASGIAVWTTWLQSDAEALMRWLVDSNVLPVTETALILWRESAEAAPARTKFREAAAKIAPKVNMYAL